MTAAATSTARRLTYQLETLWDYDYVPTHHELESLYETAKKNQWNGSQASVAGDEGPGTAAQTVRQRHSRGELP